MHLCCFHLFQDSISYSDCACAAKAGDTSEQMKKGYCHVDCGLKFMLFMAVVSLLPFLTFMNNTPAFIVTLRFVINLIQCHLD